MAANEKMNQPIDPGGINADNSTNIREDEKVATEKNDINAAGTLTPISNTANDEEESLEVRLERLGRARPECFKSTWQEAGFVFSIAMSQVLAVIITPHRSTATLTNKVTGILRLRLYCDAPNHRQRTRHPS